jgi:alkylation response protein AidB-like acyl-CoA dehydrogenase
MDFRLSSELQELQAEAETVAADAVARYGRFNDSWLCGFSREFSRELAERKWLGMAWPEEFGGGGRTPLERLIVSEALISAGAPVAASWFADRQMGPAFIAFGTAEQQAEFLPPMLAGESTWCIGMSEPDSGSDLASLATRADRVGDEWVINGRKIWTSFAAQADYCYLICRTESVAGKPHLGISEIVVPMDTPGIEVRPIRDMVDARHFNEVWFDDVRVPAANLVGTEGNAFAQTMRQLEHERGGIDRLVSNRALYLHARDLADRSDPIVRQEIADLEIGYTVGRLLVIRSVLGQTPPGFSAATKCACTEYEQRVADFVARTLGPQAMIWDQIGKGIAYAPGYTIMGGTSNVIRNILGERVLGLPR